MRRVTPSSGKLPSAQQFAKSRNQEKSENRRRNQGRCLHLRPQKVDFPKCFSRFRTACPGRLISEILFKICCSEIEKFRQPATLYEKTPPKSPKSELVLEFSDQNPRFFPGFFRRYSTVSRCRSTSLLALFSPETAQTHPKSRFWPRLYPKIRFQSENLLLLAIFDQNARFFPVFSRRFGAV